MNKARVLVIDDEPNILKVIEVSLNSQNFKSELYNNPYDGLKRVQEIYFDLAFVDLKMEPIDGIQVLTEIKRISPDTTIVLITAHASIETAVDAIKKGAYDYICKPFTHQEFIHIVERVYEHHKLLKEVRGLKAQLEEIYSADDVITKNYQIREIIRLAHQVADSDIPVLIEGQSGTGKELFARFIHSKSERRAKPFVVINCSAIPENLFESEVFGHVKGAFTGALADRIGRFEIADGGTVFLDEVAEIPPSIQVKLLRFLQNMEFERVGESITRKTNVRIISATNKNIDEELKSGRLRDDFYYRLNGTRIKIPSLSEREDDIPVLTEYFINKYSSGKNISISPKTLMTLKTYKWPGNIRELENVIKRAIVLAKDKIIHPEHLPIEITGKLLEQSQKKLLTLDDIEKNHILETLKIITDPKQAAKTLGISTTTLWRKRKKYKI